ncbi:MAG: fumarylacetoacetate hydrolase family protein [Candidatus Devosia symbiotica]|nr:fumarylacetoacetate hydrolase family protein [Candidatus Devosia symbiotica]
MKLLRIGVRGAEKPAILTEDGSIRNLSGIVDDISGAALTAAGLATIAATDLITFPEFDGGDRIGPCVANVGKFICIGLNYVDHAAETGAALPKEPILFMKATSAIIGAEACYVDKANALDHVAGYCVVNDLSERYFQTKRSDQWVKGKSADTFGPIGPWFVTRDEVANLQDLSMWLEVDGHRYQDSLIWTVMFGVAHLGSYVSQFMSLQPGDIITTSTPPGVGMDIKPEPVWLQPDNVMRLGIEGLGEQQQTVNVYSA